MRINSLIAGLRTNKPLVFGISALFIGTGFAFVGFTALFVAALVYVLAIGVPYPAIFRSFVARLVAGFLLGFSIIQVAAAVQFFVAPASTFGVLCAISGIIALGLVLATYKQIPGERRPIWQNNDWAACIAVVCFVLPFAVLCFWKNDPASITSFASAQSMDGASHYIAVTEMGGTQHLNYQTVQYYPKGFHLAEALVMNALHVHQKDVTWEANARVYVLTYLAWGAVLVYVLFYAASQFLTQLFGRTKQKLPIFLLAVAFGPVIAALYALPFAHEGFLNYYYICAAVVLGVLFLQQYNPGQKDTQWFAVAYFVLAFGVAMSWGPLLAPLLVAAPVLYMMRGETNLMVLARRVLARDRWWVVAALLLQLVPLYLHLKYAKLSDAQGLNATGGLTAFHFGIIAIGMATVLYVLLARTIAEDIKRFAGYVLTPFLGLVVLFASIQLCMVGELRYYAIKTSYLLEMLVLALVAALLVYAVVRSGMELVNRWLVTVVVFCAGTILVLAVTANPFEIMRQMFRGIAHRGNPDIALFTTLGREGKLGGTNTASLHYNATNNTLTGNALISNWANLMQYNSDSTPASAACTGVIFSTLTFPTGKPEDQATLTDAVRTCIAQALARNRPYFIVTDPASLPHLRELFGEAPTYVY